MDEDTPSPPGEGGFGPRPGQSCDHCSRRRRKCDRGNPCSLCKSLGRPCTYAREIQKRGPKKASEKRRLAAAELGIDLPEDDIDEPPPVKRRKTETKAKRTVVSVGSSPAPTPAAAAARASPVAKSSLSTMPSGSSAQLPMLQQHQQNMAAAVPAAAPAPDPYYRYGSGYSSAPSPYQPAPPSPGSYYGYAGYPPQPVVAAGYYAAASPASMGGYYGQQQPYYVPSPPYLNGTPSPGPTGAPSPYYSQQPVPNPVDAWGRSAYSNYPHAYGAAGAVDYGRQSWEQQQDSRGSHPAESPQFGTTTTATYGQNDQSYAANGSTDPIVVAGQPQSGNASGNANAGGYRSMGGEPGFWGIVMGPSADGAPVYRSVDESQSEKSDEGSDHQHQALITANGNSSLSAMKLANGGLSIGTNNSAMFSEPSLMNNVGMMGGPLGNTLASILRGGNAAPNSMPTQAGMPLPSSLRSADLLYLADLASSNRPFVGGTAPLIKHVSIMDDLPELPPPEVLAFLLDVYFLTVHHHQPVFHQAAFLASLPSQPLFLVWAMAAAAISFIPAADSDSAVAHEIRAMETPEITQHLRGKRRFHVQTSLVERTKRILLRVVQATAVGGPANVFVTKGFRIAKLASLVLLGMSTMARFYKGAMEFTDALIKMATEEALAMGLNRDPPPSASLPQTPGSEPAWILEETGRRLWYFIYLSDVVASLGLNRPIAIPPTETLASAPVAESVWAKGLDTQEPLWRVPAAAMMDGWDRPAGAEDALLETEVSQLVATGRAMEEVLAGLHRYLMRAGIEFYCPKRKDAPWLLALQRFKLVKAYLDRVYMRLPSWVREMDQDPETFLANMSPEVRKAGDKSVAHACYSLASLHAAWCTLYSPPAPILESRETQVWLAHGRPDPSLFGSGGPEELFHVSASVPARVAGATAFDGFPVAVGEDGGLAASPVSLCFFHQHRRALLTKIILVVDPDTTLRNGIAGLLGSQTFVLRLLLRDLYIENALGRLAGEALASGKELTTADAEQLINRGKQEGAAAAATAATDLESQVLESEPGSKQCRAGAASFMIMKFLAHRATTTGPVPGAVGNNRFVGVKFSSIGAIGGEARDSFMTLLLQGPDKADPGIKAMEDIEETGKNSREVEPETTGGTEVVPLSS